MFNGLKETRKGNTTPPISLAFGLSTLGNNLTGFKAALVKLLKGKDIFKFIYGMNSKVTTHTVQ